MLEILFISWRYTSLIYYTKLHLAASEMKDVVEIDLIFKIAIEEVCIISVV